MAQKQVLILEDDIQGGEATETFGFAFDGTEYEIDLNDKNAAKMRQAITFYTDHARKVGGSGRRASSNRGRSTSTGVDNSAVRAWAASNGVELSSRGRIPAKVIEQFHAAGN